MNIDDEKGSGGYWDKAAEIATEIGLNFKNRYPDKFSADEPVYAEDFGQEIIYNALKYRIDKDTQQTEENAESYKVKFIFPLFGHMYDVEEGLYCDISSVQLTYYRELLEDFMEDYQVDNGKGMEQYFYDNPDIESKLESIVWSFEKINNKLYGVTTVELSESIDADEINELREWISGQNSDGLGEGFEQQEFDVEEGRLSVSLWDFKNYFIYTQEEMDELPEQTGGMNLCQ